MNFFLKSDEALSCLSDWYVQMKDYDERSALSMSLWIGVGRKYRNSTQNLRIVRGSIFLSQSYKKSVYS